MRKALIFSDDLSLPLDYATSRNMILGQSGSGKSNVCVVLAEEMHRIGIPWITIDNKGDWYGVRSNRSGKQRGLDVPVFGGEFGDMPLSPLAGARMAELAASGKFAGVLDTSDFGKASDVSRFLTDFANTLLKKNRRPIHLFLEECDDFLPQGGFRGQIDPLAAACVGAMKRLARKCRFRGIGYTLISQRAAEVNKTALYQCETLIALRMVGDLDVKWIEGWVKRSSKRAPELLETLHELRDGECWVWSPQRLKLIQRVQARRRETFDSGATPEIGKARVVPKLAPVELDALRKELADLEEQAKADDPVLLKRKVAELEKELSKKKTVSVPKIERVEVPAKVDWKRLTRKLISDFDKSINAAVAEVERNNDEREPPKPSPFRGELPRKPPPSAPRSVPKPPKPSSGDSVVGGGLRRMMIALAQRPKGLTNRQLGVRAGLSSSSGTFSTYLSKGRSEGWIRDEGSVRFLTDAGVDALGNFEPLPEGVELLNYWLGELGGGAARMLRSLAAVYPGGVSNEALGAMSEIKHTSGTFSTYLSKLRTLELVEGGRGEIKMSDELS